LLTPAAEARLDGTNGIPGTLAQVEQQDEGHARLDVTGIVFRFAHAPTIALKFCPGYKSKVTVCSCLFASTAATRFSTAPIRLQVWGFLLALSCVFEFVMQ